MTVCYKATKPDGQAFRGGVTYGVGQLAKHPTSKRFGDMEPNDPGTYLSVSVEPAETLIGGSWPCRLFEVEPVGRVVRRTDGRYPHKRGCLALRVVREVEAWRALGPNGEAVAALIARAACLTADEAWDLQAAWYAAWYAGWYAARYAARHAAWDAAWDAAGDAAGYAGRGAARYAAEDAARHAARDLQTARDAAGHAAGDAAWGLGARDLITPDQFDRLYGPWASVMETATGGGD